MIFTNAGFLLLEMQHTEKVGSLRRGGPVDAEAN
jgi:hypothetical protein